MFAVIAIFCFGGIVVAGGIGIIKRVIESQGDPQADETATTEKNFESYTFFDTPYVSGYDLSGPFPML